MNCSNHSEKRARSMAESPEMADSRSSTLITSSLSYRYDAAEEQIIRSDGTGRVQSWSQRVRLIQLGRCCSCTRDPGSERRRSVIAGDKGVSQGVSQQFLTDCRVQKFISPWLFPVSFPCHRSMTVS